MNIFVLYQDPILAAKHQIDKHIVKMPLETAQLLSSAFEPGEAPYKRSHYNHPSNKWCRESKENYLWLIEHGLGLGDEFKGRYGKEHKSVEVILWCKKNIKKLNFEKKELTDFAQAMPIEYKDPSAVKAYRNYYLGAKKDIASWKRNKPDWWVEIGAPSEN